MKLKLPIMLCLVLALFTVAVTASPLNIKEHKLSIQFPDEYTVITPDTLRKHSEFIEHLHHSVNSFKQHMQNSNMIAFAATQRNDRQFQIKTWQTDFSKEIVTLKNLDTDSAYNAISALISEIPEESLKGWNFIDVNSQPFYEIRVEADGFCFLQYVTIQNGNYYAVVYYNNLSNQLDSNSVDEARSVVNTLVIEQNKPLFDILDGNTVIQIIITAIIIIAAAVAVVLIIISFIRDLLRKSEQDAAGIKIKRRKLK